MREHIDFVQSQYIEWQDGTRFDLHGTEVKLLSFEDDAKDVSLVVKFPAGYQGHLTRQGLDLEIYVLAGSGHITETAFTEYDYAFYPNGEAVQNLTCTQEMVALLFYSASAATADTAPEKVAARRVPRISLAEIDWDGDFQRFGLESMKSGARMKVLRIDPYDGNTSYVTSTFAFRKGVQAERHPIAQEFYMLAGELAGPLGIMQAGAYCYRPPMAVHAPYGSPTGALILFRSHGGEQMTYWEDAAPFTFRPELQPILPPRLQHLAKPWPKQANY